MFCAVSDMPGELGRGRTDAEIPPASARWRASAAFEELEQIAQKFLRGAVGGDDVESLLDVAANDVGYRDGELRARSAGCISARISSRRCSASSNGNRARGRRAAAPPAPDAIGAEREQQRRRPTAAGSSHAGRTILRSADVADVLRETSVAAAAASMRRRAARPRRSRTAPRKPRPRRRRGARCGCPRLHARLRSRVLKNRCSAGM